MHFKLHGKTFTGNKCYIDQALNTEPASRVEALRCLHKQMEIMYGWKRWMNVETDDQIYLNQ